MLPDAAAIRGVSNGLSSCHADKITDLLLSIYAVQTWCFRQDSNLRHGLGRALTAPSMASTSYFDLLGVSGGRVTRRWTTLVCVTNRVTGALLYTATAPVGDPDGLLARH